MKLQVPESMYTPIKASYPGKFHFDFNFVLMIIFISLLFLYFFSEQNELTK